MLCSIQGRFLMTEQAARYFEPFDLDVTLRDAALDAQNRPTRRMLANAAIGIHGAYAFYSVRVLRVATPSVHERATRRKRKPASILTTSARHDCLSCIPF